jgi:hypothetical protein
MGNSLFRLTGPVVLALFFASPARAIGPCATDWMDFSGSTPGIKAPSWPSDVTPPGAVSGKRFNAIHGRSRPNGTTTDRNNVWAVGDDGVIIKFDGTNWNNVASPVSDVNLYDVYILPKANADGYMGFAVGERGTVLKMDSGGVWSVVNHPAPGDCGTVGGASPINICATLYDIFPVDNENENTALMAIGQPQDIPPNDCSTVPACPAWGNEPTILMYIPGIGWSRLTSTPTGSGYRFNTFGWSFDYNASTPTSFTGIVTANTGPTSPTDGAIFDSAYVRITIGLDGATSTWKKIGTGADAHPSNPSPRYYASANTGSYVVYFGDTDTDNYYAGAITGAKTSTNMFCFLNDGEPVRAVDTGMVAAKYGTVRAMDFLSLWGFGIGVGFGQAGGAGYTVVDSASRAYFMLMNVYDPTKLPAPEDPISLNTVQYWQAPGVAWDRLNGCYITAYNEAWAVGNNGRILHWIGPAVPPAALDIALSTTRTGMWVQVTMTVTNTGGGVALSLATSLAPTPGSANLDCGPLCSTSYCVASPACPTTLAPAGVANFTWSYTMTGWHPVTFTGKADAIDLLSAKAVTDSAVITVVPPALAQMSITTNPFWPNNHIFTITMTVTNTGFKTASPVTPAPALTGVPAGAVLLGGPTPPSFTPLGPGADTSFVYTYSATGALPWTFNGCVDLDLGGDGTEIVTACDNETTKTESNPLKASLSIETIIAGAKSYYSTLILTVTNTGDEDALTVVPWISQPSAPAGGIMTSGPSPLAVVPSILAGGGQASFTWTYNVMGSLPFTFTACGSGFASSSGAPIMACAKATANSAYSPLQAALSVSAVQSGATFYTATVVLTVTNAGSEDVKNLNPAATLTAPANSILNSSPAPSAGPLTPGNGMSFTWSYCTPATLPLGFTGDLTALGDPSGANLYISASGTATSVFSPLVGSMTVSAIRSGPTSNFVTVVMNVTNVGAEDAIDLAADIKAAPVGAVLVGGPVGPGASALPYAGPVPNSGNAAFTWWYNTGSLPATFSATLTAKGSPSLSPEFATATGSATAATTPLAAAVAASMIQAGPATYFCTIDLTVTNNGTDTATVVWPEPALSAPAGATISTGPLPPTGGPLAPGSWVTFTYTYNVTGTPPFAFTGCATGSYPPAAPAPGYNAYICAVGSPSKAVSLLDGSIAVSTMQACPSNDYDYYFEIVMTITNTGLEDIVNLTPGATLTANPVTASLLSGPTPKTDAGPIPPLPNPGASRAFTWTYNATGALPFDFAGNATALQSKSGISVFGTAAGEASSSGVLQMTSAMTVSAEREESVGLAGRWKLTLVMTVTNSGKASVTNFVMSITPSPAGRALLTSGPRYSPAWVGSMPPFGGTSSFTWSYTSAGKVDLSFTGDVCAQTMPAGVPAFTTCSANISLGDTGTPGLYVVNRNLFRGRSETVTASFNLKEGGTTSLSVFNSIGQRVRILFNGYADGRLDYDFEWDGTNDSGERVASGAYYLRLEGKRFVATKKVALIK